MIRPAGPAANVLMRLKFENMKSSWVWTSLILIQTKKRARRQRARGLEATWKKKDLTQENPLLKLLTLMLSRKGFSKQGCCPLDQYIVVRYLSRFFDCWAHETTYAYIGNKHFFTKSCHRHTYQNSKISRQKMPIKSEFSISKFIRISLIFFHWRISI